MKRITVIIATYNGEKVIENTIKSILNQDDNNRLFTIELIAVDDRSTDNTFSILQTYKTCTILQNKQNSGGPNKGRNIGLKIASGDYICIADQDDEWEKDKIISLLPFIDKAPIITSGYNVIDTSTQKEFIRVADERKSHISYKKNQTFLQKLSKNWKGQNTYLGAIMFSKELKDILFEEHFGMVDFDWVLRLFHQQESIEVCKSLYTRIVDGNNLSLNEKYRRYDFYYSLICIENYQETYPKESLTGYKRLHGSRARYYYLVGDMKQARFYFLRAEHNVKTLVYFLTTFIGSKWVKKYFNVFG